jgi:hypothetical protein
VRVRAVALLGGVLVAISACGGGGTAESAPATVTVTAPAAPPELDGTQGYGDIGETGTSASCAPTWRRAAWSVRTSPR